MAYVRVIDFRDHPPTLPPDDPHLKLLPWPGIRRNGIDASCFSHCDQCGMPITVFPGDTDEIFCTECTEEFVDSELHAKHEDDGDPLCGDGDDDGYDDDDDDDLD